MVCRPGRAPMELIMPAARLETPLLVVISAKAQPRFSAALHGCGSGLWPRFAPRRRDQKPTAKIRNDSRIPIRLSVSAPSVAPSPSSAQRIPAPGRTPTDRAVLAHGPTLSYLARASITCSTASQTGRGTPLRALSAGTAVVCRKRSDRTLPSAVFVLGKPAGIMDR
jgi:hypothetical protein